MTFYLGQKVIAKIQMVSDLRDHGMGLEICAEAGEMLEIKEVQGYGRYVVKNDVRPSCRFVVTDCEITSV